MILCWTAAVYSCVRLLKVIKNKVKFLVLYVFVCLASKSDSDRTQRGYKLEKLNASHTFSKCGKSIQSAQFQGGRPRLVSPVHPSLVRGLYKVFLQNIMISQ